jgi:pimeloyl-ACP methyl ester carboxylesterase
MRSLRYVISLFFISTAGCKSVPEPRALAPEQRPTVMIFLPGIAGTMISHDGLFKPLVDEGAVDRVELIDWVGNRVGLGALMQRDRNRQLALDIASRIREIRSEPNRPHVVLAAHSGGSSLAVWALEDLREDESIDALLLLAPALSPTYDLSKPLSRVDRAYHFWCKSDRILLQLGTNLFGTADGPRTDAAGRVGFVKPPSASDAQYAKLEQIELRQADLEVSALYSHVGMLMPGYVKREIAPRLKAR